jgi:hypothetical protein
MHSAAHREEIAYGPWFDRESSQLAAQQWAIQQV